jgi:hypothetical protein
VRVFTAAERSLRGRIGGLAREAQGDGREATRRAREAAAARLEERLIAQVDARGDLSPEERAYRVFQARRAYFAALSLRSAVARRRASKRARTSVRGLKDKAP